MARTPVRLFLWLVGVFGIVVCSLWFELTQPLFDRRNAHARQRLADPSRLRLVTTRLVDEYYPRDFTHPENLDRAARDISEEMRRAGAVVEEQAFSVEGKMYRNVSGTFGPASKQRIVLGAHYDVAGVHPGADDNASGVAGMLELARLFASSPPSCRVDMVAYTLEEPPFFRTPNMGSAVHAAALSRAGADVRVMISIEMIGTFSDAQGTQSYPFPGLGWIYPSSGNFIAIVGRLGEEGLVRRVKAGMRQGSDLPVRSINAPAFVPGIDYSDHLNYWYHGVQAVMITDTSFYRTPRYHSDADLPNTLDFDRMAKVVDGLHEVVLQLTQQAAGR